MAGNRRLTRQKRAVAASDLGGGTSGCSDVRGEGGRGLCAGCASWWRVPLSTHSEKRAGEAGHLSDRRWHFQY